MTSFPLHLHVQGRYGGMTAVCDSARARLTIGGRHPSNRLTAMPANRVARSWRVQARSVGPPLAGGSGPSCVSGGDGVVPNTISAPDPHGASRGSLLPMTGRAPCPHRISFHAMKVCQTGRMRQLLGASALAIRPRRRDVIALASLFDGEAPAGGLVLKLCSTRAAPVTERSRAAFPQANAPKASPRSNRPARIRQAVVPPPSRDLQHATEVCTTTPTFVCRVATGEFAGGIPPLGQALNEPCNHPVAASAIGSKDTKQHACSMRAPCQNSAKGRPRLERKGHVSHKAMLIRRLEQEGEANDRIAVQVRGIVQSEILAGSREYFSGRP